MNEQLKKRDILLRMRKHGYTLKDADIVLDDVLKVITEALAEGDTVFLQGFGIFSVWDRPSHDMIDLRTGEHRMTRPTRAVKFKPGRGLKRAVQEGIVRK